MRFGGVLRRGKGRGKELSISGPDSDDSWQKLYKKPDKNLAKTSHKKVSSKTPSTSSKSSEKLNNGIEVSLNRTSSPRVLLERLSSDLKTTQKTRGSLPLITSTPFTRHKQAPEFEVSSIISPIDISANEGQTHDAPFGDAETTLKVNKKHPCQLSDDLFDNLLDPGKKVSIQSPHDPIGVKTIGTLQNQGDTTRHYAGGATRKRGTGHVDLSQVIENPENSWVTTDGTASTSPITSGKIIRKSQRVSNTDSHSAGTPDTECKENRIDDNVLKPSKQSENNLKVTANSKDPSNIVALSKKPEKLQNFQLEENEIERGKTSRVKTQECTDKVEGTLEPCQSQARLSTSNVKPSKIAEDTQTKQRQVSVTSEKKRTEGPLEHPHSNECSREVNVVKDSSDKEEHPSMLQCEGNGKEESQRILVDSVTRKDCEKELEGKHSGNRAVECVSMEDGLTSKKRTNVVAVVKQPTNDMLKNPELSADPKGVICFRSEFACQIGGKLFTQSSSLGFSIQYNRNERKNLPSADTAITASTCTSQQVIEQEIPQPEKSSLNQPHGILSKHCNTKSQEVRQTAVKSCSDGTLQHLNPPSQPEVPDDCMSSQTKKSLLDGAKSTDDVLQHESASNLNTNSNYNVPLRTDSSSEEERQVLRAQSIKLREKQSHSRNSRSPKICGIQPLSLDHQNDKERFISAPSSEINFKKSHDSPLEEKRKSLRRRREEQWRALSHHESTDDENTQHLKTLAPGHSENSRDDSSEDLVFISRNPAHIGDISHDDDIELEIISSTDEERSPQKNIHRQNKQSINVKSNVQKQEEKKTLSQPLKPRKLSQKLKEIRHRRERKLMATTDSEDQKPHCSKGFSCQTSVSHERKQILAECVDGDASDECSSPVVAKKKRKRSSAHHVEDGNIERKRQLSEEVPAEVSDQPVLEEETPYVDNQQDLNMVKASNINETAEGNIQCSGKNATKSAKLNANISLNSVNLRKEEHQKQLRTEATVHDFQSLQEKMLAELERPLEENKSNGKNFKKIKTGPLSKVLKSPRNKTKRKQNPVGEKRRFSPNIDVKEDHPVEMSEEKQVISLEKEGEEHKTGLRCSKRARIPPTMYWLGQRTEYKILDNGCKEVVKIGSVAPHTKSVETEHQPGHPKNNKRKLRKETSEVKSKKRAKQTVSKVTTTCQNSDACASLEDDKVLFCEAGNVEMQNSSHITSDDIPQIQEAKCVRGFGLNGSLLALNVGAKYEKHKLTTCNKMFYVLEGEVSYHANQEEKKFVAGSFFIVPKDEDHLIENSSDSKVKLVVVSSKA